MFSQPNDLQPCSHSTVVSPNELRSSLLSDIHEIHWNTTWCLGVSLRHWKCQLPESVNDRVTHSSIFPGFETPMAHGKLNTVSLECSTYGNRAFWKHPYKWIHLNTLENTLFYKCPRFIAGCFFPKSTTIDIVVQSTTPEFHRIPRLANMAMSKQDTVFQNHRFFWLKMWVCLWKWRAFGFGSTVLLMFK